MREVAVAAAVSGSSWASIISHSPPVRTVRGGVSAIGADREKSRRTRKRSDTSAGVSIPLRHTSPSPCAACTSPVENNAPGRITGR